MQYAYHLCLQFGTRCAITLINLYTLYENHISKLKNVLTKGLLWAEQQKDDTIVNYLTYKDILDRVNMACM